MKHLNIRKHLSFVLVLVLCMSLTVPAFAAEDRIVSDAEVSAVLSQINEEYGTNIHALSADELISLGLPVSEPKPMTASELMALENTLRHIAETQIPQFVAATQEPNAVLSSIHTSTVSSGNELRATSTPITATKDIDYATAGAVAYTSKTILYLDVKLFLTFVISFVIMYIENKKGGCSNEHRYWNYHWYSDLEYFYFNCRYDN